jgi:hypothetical protein
VAFDSLKFQPGLPCPTLQRLAGGPPLKRPYGYFRGGSLTGQVTCGRLIPLLTPDGVHPCRAVHPCRTPMPYTHAHAVHNGFSLCQILGHKDSHKKHSGHNLESKYRWEKSNVILAKVFSQELPNFFQHCSYYFLLILLFCSYYFFQHCSYYKNKGIA